MGKIIVFIHYSLITTEGAFLQNKIEFGCSKAEV